MGPWNLENAIKDRFVINSNVGIEDGPKFRHRGTFNDYVDMILPFFDHLPTSTLTFLPWTWKKLLFLDHLPTHLLLFPYSLNVPQGILLDSSRNFMPLDVIENVINGMAFNKVKKNL